MSHGGFSHCDTYCISANSLGQLPSAARVTQIMPKTGRNQYHPPIEYHGDDNDGAEGDGENDPDLNNIDDDEDDSIQRELDSELDRQLEEMIDENQREIEEELQRQIDEQIHGEFQKQMDEYLEEEMDEYKLQYDTTGILNQHLAMLKVTQEEPSSSAPADVPSALTVTDINEQINQVIDHYRSQNNLEWTDGMQLHGTFFFMLSCKVILPETRMRLVSICVF